MNINKETEIEIIRLSYFNTQKDISKSLNISIKKISQILRENNISTGRKRLNESKLKFNINYFDVIDTKEKAYWLGFISADGCLKNNRVRLVSKDEEVIVKFKKAIESEHKIVQSITTDKRSNKKYMSYYISITNNLFTRKLEKYVNVDKSHYFVMPEIDNELNSYFIAGMFDGDGSFTIYGKNNHRIRASLISTNECLIQIRDILLNRGFSKTKIVEYKNYRVLFLYKNALDFLDYIYNDELSGVYLSRKYEKYKKYKNERE